MLLKLIGAPEGTTCPPPTPTRVSVVIMAGNEAHFIADAIRSAAWADEVVVLDTGSTDGTGDLAASLGARVTREPWRTVDLGDGLRAIDDFASARNRSIELATGDWIVLLDADERFDADDLRTILETMPACVMWGSMALEHVGRPELAQVMCRLFRREARAEYRHRLHEVLVDRVRALPSFEIPREGGRVVHLGGAHDVRAKHRRDERNWRLVQRMMAEDRDDVHTLSYAVAMLTQFGRSTEAEVLAAHAFRLATPKDAARHRIVMALCEFHGRRGDYAEALAVIDEAASRWDLDANCRAARGLIWLGMGRDGWADELRAALADQWSHLAPVMRQQCDRALEVPLAAE